MRRRGRGTDIPRVMIATDRSSYRRSHHHQRALRRFIEFVATAAIMLTLTLLLVGGVVGKATSSFACTARSLASATHTCDRPR